MRRYAVLLALTLLGAQPAVAAPPPAPAKWAASWLATRIGPGGYVAGPDGTADPAGTTVVALALAVAGIEKATVEKAVAYLGAHVDDYARRNDADRPGALGRLALLAHATGRDPNAFGGTAPANRLVDRILATRTLAGPSAGMFADPLYAGTFTHAIGLLGVAVAKSLTVAQQDAVRQAVDFMVVQQCDGGGWQNGARPALLGVALTACTTGANGPDTNASAFAVQALAAHQRAPRVDPLAWFDAAQNTKGGFGYLPGGATDADSTALVVQAIVASRADPAAARFTSGGLSAYGALMALQIGCAGKAAERGAFAYMRGTDGSLRPNLYATAEATPAVARAAFPIRRATATTGRVTMPCGRR